VPVLATGIGDVFEEVQVDLSEHRLVLVKPRLHVATLEAYGTVALRPGGRQLRSAIDGPVAKWRETIYNDFEPGIFAAHPQIAAIKAQLYAHGALYAAMSGSGSAVYGLFNKSIKLVDLEKDNQVFY